MYDIDDFVESLKEASDMVDEDHRHYRDMIRFTAGGEGQWAGNDLTKLKDEQRPALTINQTKPVISAVSGSEIVNRFEPRFLPRSPSLQDVDSYASDAMSTVYKWVRQQADVEHHESKAFKNTATTGLGFLHTFLDYTENPWGQIRTVWVPLFEMAHDPNAKQMNLKDSQYFIRGKWLPSEDFKMMWPDAFDEVISTNVGQTAPFSGFAGQRSTVGGNYDPNNRQGTTVSGWYDNKNERILVYEWQYTYKEMWNRVFLPPGAVVSYETDAEDANLDGMRVLQNVSWMPLDEEDRFMEEAAALEVDPATIDIVKMPRQIYRSKMVSGETDLEDSLIRVGAFTFQAVTGFEDESAEERIKWRGLTYDMLDPQRMVNKTISQMIYFLSLNPNALLAEEGVFTDKEQAESDLSNPAKIVTVSRNALTQGRIRDKLGRAPIPTGFEAILAFAMDAIPKTGGVNPYFMGAVNDLKRTAGSAVQSVQRQSMTILSTLMDSLRLHRKDHARLVMRFVQEYMPIEQVNRVLSPELREAGAGEMIMSHDITEFDIIIDEAPTTPNAQAEFRSDMMQTNFLPQLMQMGVPMPPEIFGYLGLPATVGAKWQQLYEQWLAAQMGGGPPQQPGAGGGNGQPPPS